MRMEWGDIAEKHGGQRIGLQASLENTMDHGPQRYQQTQGRHSTQCLPRLHHVSGTVLRVCMYGRTSCPQFHEAATVFMLLEQWRQPS